MGRRASVVVSCLGLLCFVGCGGGGGGGSTPPVSPEITSVSATCSPASINTAQTSTCSATVTGTGSYSSAVTWTATGGTITSAGVFTPSATGTATITATSTQDSTKSGNASVTVPNPVPSITGLLPPSVAVGASDTSVAISGSGFTGKTSAALDGVSLYTTFGSSSSIQATIPASMLGSAQLHLMTVTNPAPGGGTSTSVAPWISTGAMNAGRANHTQTLLQSGKVLVAGGGWFSGLLYSFTASAELYDPVSRAFVTTGSMGTPRAFQTATALGNGKVLVAGGTSASVNGSPSLGALASAELYDPSTGIFSPTGSMVSTRMDATATLLPDGTVLIAGGADSAGNILNSAQIYNSATGTFTATGTMSAARLGHSAALLPNGQVLIAGGESTQANVKVDLNTAELYNPATGKFTPTGNLVAGRESPIAVTLPNGKVLVAGGYQIPSGVLLEAEIYNSATATFTPTGSMGAPRYLHSAAVLSDGTVLIVGGSDGSTALTSTEIYTPSTGQFAPNWTTSVARVWTVATTLSDGSVFVSGGEGITSANQPLASAEVYPPPSSSNATKAAQFVVNNPLPAIIGVSPSSAPSGTQVTITGSNFVSSSELMVNGLAVPSYGDISQPGKIWFYPSVVGPNSVAVNNPSPGGGISNSASFNVTVNVQVTPARALWNPGSSNQFSATVLGATNQNVSWSVKEGTAGGTITGRGVYTASSVAGTFHVIATSQADQTQSATATVIVGPGAGQMVAGPQMTIGRSEHTATLLLNGKVLIAGGDMASSSSTAEIYNPAANTFTSTGSMSVPRYTHTATLLKSGKVLVLGGFDYNSNNSTSPSPGAELYDPATGTFSSAGSMINPSRGTCTSTILSNGQVLVAGGGGATAELYDPSTGIFSATGSMATPRTQHTATLLNNGKVLIAGGIDGSASLSSAELYDPASGTFSSTGSMTVPRRLATAVLLGNGKVMIMGQTQDVVGPADIYDPATGTFTQTATLPTYPNEVNQVSAALLPNGLEYIAGGTLLLGNGGALAANQTVFFDPNNGTFYAGPLMSDNRNWNTMTVLFNGSVLITGGMGTLTSGSSTDLYSPATTNPLP